MNQTAEQPERDGNGRFVPGQSGNPRGKAPGTRNRATVLRALMRYGDEDAIGRVLIDRALGGDPVAARFLMEGLTPKPRQRTITLDLSEGTDAAAIFLAAAEAVVAGEISPQEAMAVVRFVEEGQRMVQAAADIKRANAARALHSTCKSTIADRDRPARASRPPPIAPSPDISRRAAHP